jgi:type II secretory pathway component PulF
MKNASWFKKWWWLFLLTGLLLLLVFLLWDAQRKVNDIESQIRQTNSKP